MIPPHLVGTLTQDEIVSAIKNGTLAELWIEVGPWCDLHCANCFNGCGEEWIDQAVFSNMLTPLEYKELVERFAAHGGKTVGIPGAGEPCHFKNAPYLDAILSKCRELGLGRYVFTSGKGLIWSKWKEREVYDEVILTQDASLVLKYNSARPEVQDALVRYRGYTDSRQRKLKQIVKQRFTTGRAKGTTRLSFVTSIMSENLAELPDIWRFCRQHNIAPDIDTNLEFGRGASVTPLPRWIMLAAYRELQRIDSEEFDIEWDITSPTYVAGHCQRTQYGMYITYEGNISPCLGAAQQEIFLGNVRDTPLECAWNSPLMRKIRARDYCGDCPTCRNFQSGGCNSCLGRCAETISEDNIVTKRCWLYKR
jgi:MoaA/NifB/PqqE/SkfB family radical SAM enzyme